MLSATNQRVFLALILSGFIVWSSAEGLSCSSCGDECADACGTRFFRTCCFNYLRKRSSAPSSPLQQIQQPQASATDYDGNGMYVTRNDLEKLIRKEWTRLQESQVHSEPAQKSTKADEFPKSTNSNQIDLANNRDQIRVIYDI